MASASLSAELRSETGKGVARKLRAAGRVPAVIYGHNREPQSLTLDTRELGRLLETIAAGSAGERVTVRCPLVFVGVSVGVREQGGLFEELMREVQITVDPANIPNHIDVDVASLTIGHPLHVRDLVLPPGVTVLDDADLTVCAVSGTKAAASEETTAAAGGEPEVLRAKKADA